MLKSGAGFVQFSAVWGFTVYQVWENGEKAEQSRRIASFVPHKCAMRLTRLLILLPVLTLFLTTHANGNDNLHDNGKNDGNLRTNMREWKIASLAAQFIHRTKNAIESRTGAFSVKEVDDAALAHAATAFAAVNLLRKSSMLPEFDSKDMEIMSHTVQVVAGIKHCFCISVKDSDFLQSFSGKVDFQACWIIPADKTKQPRLSSVVPNIVIMQTLVESPAVHDEFICAAIEDSPNPTPSSTTNIVDPTSSSLLLEEYLNKFPAPPKEWDYRVHQTFPNGMKENCVQVLEHAYNQGGCGSCYAFAAVAAAAARACAAGHVLWSKQLSVLDTLACGTVMAGKVCVSYRDGSQTVNYANGCDGGKSLLVNEFAVDHGLMEGTCGPTYEWTGDPTTHWSPDLECRLLNRGSEEVKVTCDDRVSRWSMKLPSTGTVRVDKLFCTCPKSQRTGFEDVEILVAPSKTQCKLKKMVQGSAMITCDDGMKINKKISVNPKDDVGSLYVLGDDGMSICRCAHSHLTMEPINAFQLYEDGTKATKTETCRRKSTGEVQRNKVQEIEDANGGQSCEPKKIFHSPIALTGSMTSERVMMHAIQDGGPIVADIEAYEDLSDFNGKGVYAHASNAKVSGGHAITIFGWGVESKKKFWWAKNSWGDHPTKIFKYVRGTDEGGIESRGTAWLYAQSPDHVKKFKMRRPLCVPTLMEPSAIELESKDSCLQIHETVGELGGIVNPSCTVTNICNGDERDDLPVVSFSLHLQSSKSMCGMKPNFPVDLRPGESHTFLGSFRCCIKMEEKTGRSYKREPGNCLEENKRGYLRNSKCKYTVQVYKQLDSSRYFSIAPGDKWSNIGGRFGDKYFSLSTS